MLAFSHGTVYNNTMNSTYSKSYAQSSLAAPGIPNYTVTLGMNPASSAVTTGTACLKVSSQPNSSFCAGARGLGGNGNASVSVVVPQGTQVFWLCATLVGFSSWTGAGLNGWTEQCPQRLANPITITSVVTIYANYQPLQSAQPTTATTTIVPTTMPTSSASTTTTSTIASTSSISTTTTINTTGKVMPGGEAIQSNTALYVVVGIIVVIIAIGTALLMRKGKGGAKPVPAPTMQKPEAKSQPA